MDTMSCTAYFYTNWKKS